MCQIAVERPFDRLWSSQMLKVASLSAQALSSEVLHVAKRTIKSFAKAGRFSARTLIPRPDTGLPIPEKGLVDA